MNGIAKPASLTKKINLKRYKFVVMTDRATAAEAAAI